MKDKHGKYVCCVMCVKGMREREKHTQVPI